MSGPKYLTVPEELIEHADAAAGYFRTYGYSVAIERQQIGFPYTPALVCRRQQTTLVVEMDSRIDLDRLEEWARYGHSCARDTRVAVVVDASASISAEAEGLLRERGIGLYVSASAGVNERIAPQDLAVNVQLPALASQKARIRKLLGSVYEQFDRSNWREGFEEACQVVESEARRYLKDGVKRKRIVVTDRIGRVRKLDAAAIERMTMGQLARAFQNIQRQNHTVAVVADVLGRLNKDRVGVVHHKAKRGTEIRLRRNVGQHMWAILAALKALLDIK
jgi:hypothetical protein